MLTWIMIAILYLNSTFEMHIKFVLIFRYLTNFFIIIIIIIIIVVVVAAAAVLICNG